MWCWWGVLMFIVCVVLLFVYFCCWIVVCLFIEVDVEGCDCFEV